MMEPIGVLKGLFETFDKSSIVPFRMFIQRNAAVTKWMIAADYCLHDPTRPNDSFVFSLVPYQDWFGTLQEEIKTALPRDLKNTKGIAPAATNFLSSDRRFHIGFVVDKVRAVFTEGEGNPLDIARRCIDATHKHVVEKQRSAATIKRLGRLRHESLAKRFNISLLADLLLLSWLFPFVSLLLARECNVTVLGWLPDRDNMTTWCEGVVWDFAWPNLHGGAAYFEINIPSNSPVVAVPGDQSGMWFDEFVRISDYVAGLLASWNFETNQLPGNTDKFVRLAEDVFADSSNMAVLKIVLDQAGLQCSRLVGKKEIMERP